MFAARAESTTGGQTLDRRPRRMTTFQQTAPDRARVCTGRLAIGGKVAEISLRRGCHAVGAAPAERARARAARTRRRRSASAPRPPGGAHAVVHATGIGAPAQPDGVGLRRHQEPGQVPCRGDDAGHPERPVAQRTGSSSRRPPAVCGFPRRARRSRAVRRGPS